MIFVLRTIKKATSPLVIGLVCTVVIISHCGCDDPGSISRLDSVIYW